MSQIFPVLAIAGSYGMARLWERPAARGLLLLMLAIPFVRFGPRYAELLRDDLRGQPHQWTDITLDQESRAGADRGQGSGASRRHDLRVGLSPEHRRLHQAAHRGPIVGLASGHDGPSGPGIWASRNRSMRSGLARTKAN
ncbi:MAG: hypothetical protein WDO18_15605 [Acidobacteriota bacterium]